MKNRVLHLMLALVMPLLCLGRSKDADQPVTDTQKQEIETQQTEVVEEEESTVSENVRRVKIENENSIRLMERLSSS